MTGGGEESQLEADKPPSFYVYIVCCADGTLYTGFTVDVDRRVAEHNSGHGARYTSVRCPVVLVASWGFGSRAVAMRAERAIKRLTREKKIDLIDGVYPLASFAQ